MAYLKLWPTSDWDLNSVLARAPFKTSSKLILEAKTVKCCEKNAKANAQQKKEKTIFTNSQDHDEHPHHHRRRRRQQRDHLAGAA